MKRDPLIALLVTYRGREGQLERELHQVAAAHGVARQVVTKLLTKNGALSWVWDAEQRTPDTVTELVAHRWRRHRRGRRMGERTFGLVQRWAEGHGLALAGVPDVSRCPTCGQVVRREVADLRFEVKP